MPALVTSLLQAHTETWSTHTGIHCTHIHIYIQAGFANWPNEHILDCDMELEYWERTYRIFKSQITGLNLMALLMEIVQKAPLPIFTRQRIEKGTINAPIYQVGHCTSVSNNTKEETHLDLSDTCTSSNLATLLAAWKQSKKSPRWSVVPWRRLKANKIKNCHSQSLVNDILRPTLYHSVFCAHLGPCIFCHATAGGTVYNNILTEQVCCKNSTRDKINIWSVII